MDKAEFVIEVVKLAGVSPDEKAVEEKFAWAVKFYEEKLYPLETAPAVSTATTAALADMKEWEKDARAAMGEARVLLGFWAAKLVGSIKVPGEKNYSEVDSPLEAVLSRGKPPEAAP